MPSAGRNVGTYAAFIATDRNKVIECIINGRRIDKERDTQGHMMADGYLKDKLGEMDPSIVASEKAFYETVVNCDNGEVEFQIGRELPEKRNLILIEMLEHLSILLNYTTKWLLLLLIANRDMI